MSNPDHVTLTIDGKTVSAKKGTLLVEAAREAGIEIPVFCYHPKLKSVGACRMCLVQVEKLPGLQTSCTTPVGQDMVVATASKDVVEAQNGVIELLLANHPLDCPICDKGGECPLQDNTFGWGRGVSRFQEEKRHKEKAYPLGPTIVLDRERCIMCYRCTRFHQEIPGDEALAAINRGGESQIGTLGDEPYDSIFSGNTVELCPVGALTSRQYRFKARPWDLVRTPSVCNGCAVGCNLEVHSRTEQVLRLVSRENPEVDGGWLCDRGRFDSIPAPSEARLKRPLVREGGALRTANWAEALERARAVLGSQPGVVASASLSNEALWVLDRIARRGRGTLATPDSYTPWPVQGKIANLLRSKAVVLVGLDLWTELPVLALWVRKAVIEGGARLVVVNAQNGLFRDTAHWLQAPAGEEAQVVVGLAAVLNGERPGDIGGIEAAALEAAAMAIQALDGPVSLLAGPRVLAQPGARAALENLARLIGANGETGLVGAPGLGANARGALELAPTLARETTVSDIVAGASGVLAFGDGALPAGSTRIVAVATALVGDDPRVEVALPLAHAYERQGSVTNLEGRVQEQAGGASPPTHARSDWGAAASLATALGIDTPLDLEDIRTAIVAEHPDWAGAFAAAESARQEAVPSWEGATSATSPGQGTMPLAGGAGSTGNRGA